MKLSKPQKYVEFLIDDIINKIRTASCTLTEAQFRNLSSLNETGRHFDEAMEEE